MQVKLPSEKRLEDKYLYLGIILIGANLRAPITGLGPVLADIQRDLGLDGSAAGLLNALPLLIFALLSLVAPTLACRYGLERILGSSLLAILIGTILRSLPITGAIWGGTIVLSAGIAFANVLLPGLVKRDFPHQAASLISLYAATMAAMAGISAGLAAPISQLSGMNWRWALGIWAVLSGLAFIVWMPQLHATQHHFGVMSKDDKRFISPWRHPIGWQVSLFFAFHSLIFYSLVDWFASYAASRGIAPSAAGLMLLGYQLVAVTTNLGSAPLIRRAHNQVGLGVGCGCLMLIGTSGLLFMPSWSLLWLISAGLGAGIAMVTSLSLFGLRTHDHHQAAALSGMAQFVGYAGAATGPLLMGFLHDATGKWTASFWLLIVISGLVSVFAALSGRCRLIE
ncbi:CynX/NimT family MFS transporter [Acetobacter pasteurianus]